MTESSHPGDVQQYKVATSCRSEASLTLPFPVLPHSRSTVRLGFSTPAVCLRPPRYQGRPHSAGTEGTTSGLNHPFMLTFSSTTLQPRVAITLPVTCRRPTAAVRVCPDPQPGSGQVPGRAGGYPTGPPTVPDVTDSVIRFLGHQSFDPPLTHNFAARQAPQIWWMIRGCGSGNTARSRANLSQGMELSRLRRLSQ